MHQWRAVLKGVSILDYSDLCYCVVHMIVCGEVFVCCKNRGWVCEFKYVWWSELCVYD